MVRHTGEKPPTGKKSFPYRGTPSSTVVVQGQATTASIDENVAAPETVNPQDEDDIDLPREMAMDEQDRDSKLKFPGIAVHAENIRISQTEIKEESGANNYESDTILCRTTEKPYSCSLCQKSFLKNYSLTYHMRTHTKEKPFTCTLCTQQFSTQSNLSRHMRCHTGEKPFSCGICNKLFSQNCEMKSHMRSHTGEKPFLCSHCDKSYANKSFFKMHVRKHISAISYIVSPKEATKDGPYKVTVDESYSVLPNEATEDESYSVSPKEATEDESYSVLPTKATEDESYSV